MHQVGRGRREVAEEEEEEEEDVQTEVTFLTCSIRVFFVFYNTLVGSSYPIGCLDCLD
jgi:hypothetical protein